MRVAILGDTHGDVQWIIHIIDTVRAMDITTIIQVGDLGVGFARDSSWDLVDQTLLRHGMTMMVAPGNHEDYGQIDALRPRADGWLAYRSHILLAPRGHRTVLGGRSVLWLGGAGSVDRTDRQWDAAHGGRTSWWAREAIADDEAALAAAGGHSDIMVGHDAPHGVKSLDDRLVSTAHLWDPVDLAYSDAMRMRYTRVVEEVRPDLVLHGHFHFRVRDVWRSADRQHAAHVVGLGMQWDMEGALAVLDTDTMTVQWVTVPEPKGYLTGI